TTADDGPTTTSDTNGVPCDEPPAVAPRWQSLSPPGDLPPVRHSHALAYDAARGRVVLFGGLASGYDGDDTSLLGDTWEWDGCAWTEVATEGPSPREGQGMVYDDTRGVVLLFGGNSGMAGGPSDELWQWDGAQWTLVASGGPQPRWKHGMAYDGARDRIVVFGGEPGAKDDTWEWDGAQWVDVSPLDDGPEGRSRMGMAYDVQRGETILFGGRTMGSEDLGDTWAWDGAAWEAREDVEPSGWNRSRHDMVYDSARAVMVVFGGYSGPFRNDTLEWDGATWTQVEPVTQMNPNAPSRRIYAHMAYHAALGATVLFAGFDGDPLGGDPPLQDTWLWGGP
ncbi:MAG: hypothetical protein KDK70_29320, partial [Myxococcales bacterium]|nr:hypothetical protein [Myxococcales bacterium]